MITPTINRLQFRMHREIGHCVSLLNMGNLVYVALKKEHIAQRATNVSRDIKLIHNVTSTGLFDILGKGKSPILFTNQSKGSVNLFLNNRSAAVVPSDRFK